MLPSISRPYAPIAHFAVLFFAVYSHAFEIQFNYRFDDSGFFADEARRDALEAAGHECISACFAGKIPTRWKLPTGAMHESCGTATVLRPRQELPSRRGIVQRPYPDLEPERRLNFLCPCPRRI